MSGRDNARFRLVGTLQAQADRRRSAEAPGRREFRTTCLRCERVIAAGQIAAMGRWPDGRPGHVCEECFALHERDLRERGIA